MPHNYKGSVLLVTLLIVAVIATLIYSGEILQNTVLKQYGRSKAQLATVSLASQARQLASETLLKAFSDVEPEFLDFPLQLGTLEMPPYEAQVELWNLQAFYNLNNLASPETDEQFRNLVSLLSPDNTVDLDLLLESIREWLLPSVDSERDRYYARLKPPYMPAHQSFTHKRELILVKDMTLDLYNAIRRAVFALPEGTKIDINSAPTEVIRSLGDGKMTQREAEELIAYRKSNKGFDSPAAFSSDPIVSKYGVRTEGLTTDLKNGYYLVKTKVRLPSKDRVVYAVLQAQSTIDNTSMRLVWQAMDIEA